jgi:phenylalanyl-tRNA synthetase beta chain
MMLSLNSDESPPERYDLLCIEGISRALRVFLGKDQAPNYRLVHPSDEDKRLLTVTLSPEVR